jgi:hypothetical protein
MHSKEKNSKEKEKRTEIEVAKNSHVALMFLVGANFPTSRLSSSLNGSNFKEMSNYLPFHH